MPQTADDRKASGQSPQEVELKFVLTAEEAAKLVAEPPWTVSGPADILRLHSTYFDTPAHDLLHAGFSLRIRKEGNRRIQTIKTIGNGGGSLASRGEWSCSVRSLRPVLKAETASLLRQALGADGPGDALQPVFAIEVVRHRFTVAIDGALAEIAVDAGEIKAGESHEAFHELELELLQGEKSTLFALAREIFRHMPLRLHTQSKAERGFELISGTGGAQKAARVVLTPDLAIQAAFQTIARGCLRHLLANEAAFLQMASPDAVHQARVAIRRLRAAMGLFRKFSRDDLHGRINAELRWIAGELGHAREIDVYIADMLEPAASVFSDDPDYLALRGEYERRRACSYDNAASVLTSQRFFYAILVLAQWIETGDWLKAYEETQPQLAKYAACKLDRLWRRVRRRIKDHEHLDDEALHSWRIDVKKLRYANDFFVSLYSSNGAGKRKSGALNRAMKHLTSLQDGLGLLNDIAEAGRSNPLSDIAMHLHREKLKLREDLLRKVEDDCRALVKILPLW